MPESIKGNLRFIKKGHYKIMHNKLCAYCNMRCKLIVNFPVSPLLLRFIREGEKFKRIIA